MFKDFFGYQNEGYTFKVFGLSHIIPIIMIVILILSLYLLRNKIKYFKYEATIRYYIGAFMIFTQMAYTYNNIYIGSTPEFQSKFPGMQFATIMKDLPLSLCGASMILTGFLMFNKSKKLFDITYFWVICGATLAILMPTAIADDTYGHYGPDKFRYYQFWFGHIGIVFVVFYMIFVHNYKITFRSVIDSFVYLVLFGTSVILLNNTIESNYLFLQDPTKTGLKFFPHYPYSVIIFSIIAIFLYLLAYLPWYIIERKQLK